MLQDFLVPEMRATKARLDGVDKRFDGVDRRIDELKASIEKKFEGLEKRFDRLDRQFVEERTVTLNAIENMMKKLTLRIDLTIIEGTLAEYEAKAISKESQQYHFMLKDKTIAVAMSGGVDSSTVAAMLRAEGYNLIGLTLQLWNQRRLAGREGMPEQVQGRCCSIDDVYDARRVAEDIGIPYYLVNQQERFEQAVVKPFVSEYLAGRTPIPCSLCNNHLKFDQLLLTARQIGADLIATGHYARNEYDGDRGRWILSRPADTSKDQTYFLFGLTQDQLAHTLFPLGNYTKPQVREIARENHLALAAKPDSQEICFIPGGDYKKFIDAYLDEQGEALPDTAGELVSAGGTVKGEHSGIHNFTIGQRKGLGLASPDPLYVLQIDPISHRVTVGSEQELLTQTLVARQLNWITVEKLSGQTRARIKIRHRHEPAWATLEMTGDDEVTAIFDTPQRAVTPGQSAVFYQGDEVLGGGWIV